MIGYCKLCNDFCELQRSHAIGRTVFRKMIKATKEEKFIRISLDSNKLRLCSDQWSSYQLCINCEELFNQKYENYSINSLRGKISSVFVKETILGTSYNNLDQERITLYFLSIFWRASESQHESYKDFKILDELSTILKNIFLGNSKLPNRLFHIRIQTLSDEMNIIKKEGLKKIITSPSIRYDNKNIIYEIIFEGLYVELYCKKPTNSYLKKHKYGFLRTKKNIVLFPYIDISSLENFKKTIYHGMMLEKHSQLGK